MRGALRPCLAVASVGLMLVAMLAEGSFGLLRARAEPPEQANVTFGIQRNGSPIGTHRVRYTRDRTDVIVTHEIDIQVTLALIDFYRYHLTSRERWRSGRLIALDARVDKNGSPLQVMLRAMRHETVVQSSSGRTTAPADVVPQSPSWNVLTTPRRTMLDAETGALAQVRVAAPANEALTIRGARVVTRRYVVRGGDSATLWYDPSDVLVKKRLAAPDGSTIEYVLRGGRG